MPKVSRVTIGTTRTVNVRVNTSPSTKVQTIEYSPMSPFYFISNANDYFFGNAANNMSVITYDDSIDKFVVQNVPRLNGGTF